MNDSHSISRRRFVGAAAGITLAASLHPAPVAAREKTVRPIGFAIHGGAGTILKSQLTPEREAAYHEKLTEAVTAGFAALKKGGAALDAVITAIVILEDSPLFNAGKGAVFTADGTHELDAAVMEGATLNAGAVAGVKRIKNPIALARLVMERSPHVMMSGAGAEAFAQTQSVEFVPNDHFDTEQRRMELQRAKDAERTSPAPLSHVGAPKSQKFGTVGAVALDRTGNLAAGTSTGGTTNKKFGRIGDAPIIGAGTYANNATCAVSATGHGEFFIRSVVAHDISALMEYKGLSLEQAAEEVVMKKLVKFGGAGGVIAIDRKGVITMPFNTPGMYRASIGADEKVSVGIYRP
jgi:beta-aspartyl-peptidase (threonine type)